MPIRVLPIHLVNKIAAGEVIERPGSVVKELVENALDAGATSIEVALEDGGKRLIRVCDDGDGMEAEDLALAFAPHATSKIATEDDLFAIRTMGFRGEALASIAAVSRAHIRTRRRADRGAGHAPPAARPDPAGYEVEAVGGEISPVRPCAAAVGTTVTVRDLFFNVPARRKFLRTAATELGHVSEQLTRVALANPRVAFSLWHNGRAVQKLPAVEGTLDRARDLFGEELAGGLMPIVRRAGAIGVMGLIGSPASARASGKWQYFFLNGRYVRDRLLAHALREAYRGACDPARWPAAVVFLEIDPADVDVNVHPTKIEVRFRESDRVHGEVLAALRETLNRSAMTPASLAPAGRVRATGPAETTEGAEPPSAASPEDEQRRESLRQAMADFFRSAVPRQPRFAFPEARPEDPVPRGESGPRFGSFTAAGPRESLASAKGISTIPDSPAASAKPQAADALALVSEAVGVYAPSRADAQSQAAPSPTAVPPAAIQVHQSYILAGCEDGVLIIDQHALHERILYNELQHRLASGGGLEGQRLLLPAPLSVTPSEMATLSAREDLLRRLGMEVAAFGPSSAAVQQFPTMLTKRGVAPAEFLRELLDRWSDAPPAEAENVLRDVLAMIACKAAVKAGQPLAPPEIEHLLAQAELAERAFACPHGRPAVLKLTLKDLQKQFHRT